MEYNFNCEQILCCKDGYAILEGSFQSVIFPGYLPFVNEILDSMGYASSCAQELKTIITGASKFFSSNHRICIKAEGNKVIGFIKVGTKKLFIRDELNNYNEITPLCVLDFYVEESMQRGGHGKSIFEYMLKFENVDAGNLAYDRPSPKLLGFLAKYYNLTNYVQQNNNFVVFNEYWKGKSKDKLRRTGGKIIETISSNSNQLPHSSNATNNQINTKITNSFANYGRQLVTPNKNFGNYYLYNDSTNYYDNIYSKKKLNLLNDYVHSNLKDPQEYVTEQLEIRENGLLQAKDRVEQLGNTIVNTGSNRIPNLSNDKDNYYYNKRNEFSTVYDDKKILEKKILGNNNLGITNGTYCDNYSECNQSKKINSPIIQTPYINMPIKTNILPTTSSAYGAYYSDNIGHSKTESVYSGKNNVNKKIYYY